MELLKGLLYTTLSALSILYFVVKVSLSHWKKRGILHEKPKFLWGNLKGVGQKKHIATVLQELYSKYKDKAPFIGFYAYIKPMVLVLDLDVIKCILSTDAKYFTERGLYHNVKHELLSGNLVQLDGVDWQHMHNKFESTFTLENLNNIMPALLKVSDTFKHSLSVELNANKILNINKLVNAYNVNVISSLAFNLEDNSLLQPQSEFHAMTLGLTQNFNLLKAYLAWNYPVIARLLQYKSYNELASAYFLNLAKNNIKQLETSNLQTQHNFLKLFIELKQPNFNMDLSNNEIAAQAFTFVLAGLHSCNTTMIYCLYELALHTKMQDKARNEINNVLKQHNNQINLKSLFDMKYLNQVICETLRKHSPYPFLLRRTVADYEIPNSVFMLKAGNDLVIPVSAIHYDPQIYPDPGKFDPERFSSAAIQERHTLSWLPFGVGPRACIALQFAKLQMLVGLVTLLRNYKYSPSTEIFTPIDYDKTNLFILRPKLDIKLRVESA